MPSKRFTDQLRLEAGLSTTYAKGKALAAEGGVLACSVQPSAIEGTLRVTGSVRSSHGSPYWCHAVLDMVEEALVDYGCDCPAAQQYDGICKHATALVLHALDDGADPTGMPDGIHAASGATAARPVPAPRALPTSPQIRDLVETVTALRVDEAAAARAERARARCADPDEPVELLPSIVPASDTFHYTARDNAWCLRLKVRRGKTSYVVKNMAALVSAWKSGVEFSYGKNLSFAHVPAAFTERSRALLDLVTRIVDSQQALFLSRWRYMDAGRGAEVKDLPVSSADIVAILDLFQGSAVTFDPGLPYTVSRYQAPAKKAERTLAVAQGDPPVRASLKQAQDGGYDLAIPGALSCFAADGALYLLDEETAWRCTDEYAARATPLFQALLPLTGTLHIGRGDLEDFCRSALPLLRDCTLLDAPAALEALTPPEPVFSFKIGLDEGLVTCATDVAYGTWRASVYTPAAPDQPSRDQAAEWRVMDAVEDLFPGAGPLPCFDEADDERLYLLLTEGLAELAGLGEVLLSERLRGVEVRDNPQVRVKATLKSGLLDVAVDSSGLSPRDLMAYLASYKRKQKYLRLSNGDIMRLDDSVRALNDLAEGLGVEAVELAGGVTGLPSNRTLFIDALLRKSEGVRLERNAAFRAVVRDFDTYSDADFEVPASLADVLRPYQVEGFRWLETLERFGFGGILADDMGLGKTLQVIAHILARKQAGAAEAPGDGNGGEGVPGQGQGQGPSQGQGPTLVVCPASLVYNWMAELARFAPELDTVAVLGGKAARAKLIGAAAEHDVLVTSYDLMKRDAGAYAAVHFARVVLDEAHYIKNAGTQVAKATRCLVADARFALTGTPIENRLSELWSILDFLMPGILGSREAFGKRFAGPVEAGEQGAARRLQCMVAPFILRRLKEDVLADLPDKDESVVLARMEGEQDMLYKASQDRLALQISHEMPDEFKKNKLQVLAELTRLRQICCDPHLAYENYAGGSAKLDTCMELVRSALDAGHKILLFSQFTSMLGIISERLAAEKVGHLVLTGSTSKEERARLVERFQNPAEDGEDVFLISLKAGGVGLNLTAADVVIHYDPWWNVAAQNQATDRAHRIGQTRAVSVFKLICQGTIEERIVRMQESKRNLAERVLGGEGTASTSLTREDVLALLEG